MGVRCENIIPVFHFGKEKTTFQTGSHAMYCTVYFIFLIHFHDTKRLSAKKEKLFDLAARGKRLRVRQKFEDNSNQIPAQLCFVPEIFTDVFNTCPQRHQAIYHEKRSTKQEETSFSFSSSSSTYPTFTSCYKCNFLAA